MLAKEEPSAKVRSCEVFISYQHADKAAADRLYSLLQDRQVVGWYDALIPLGADWRDSIVEQLSQACLMVILLSAKALESDQLKKELAVADQENVPLIAVRLENVKPRQAFAYELARGNWFDVFDNPEARFVQLADLLARLVADRSQIPRALEASVQARYERRRRESWGRLAFLRSPAAIASLIGCLSLLMFWLYERRAAPVEQLIAGGVAPLTAYFYVTIAVTLASPLLALSLMRGGLSLVQLPLLMGSIMNTALLFALGYAIAREIRLALRRNLRG